MARWDRQRVERLLDRYFDELSSSVILAGGSKIEREELGKMPINWLFEVCAKNRISISIRPKIPDCEICPELREIDDP